MLCDIKPCDPVIQQLLPLEYNPVNDLPVSVVNVLCNLRVVAFSLTFDIKLQMTQALSHPFLCSQSTDVGNVPAVTSVKYKASTL